MLDHQMGCLQSVSWLHWPGLDSTEMGMAYTGMREQTAYICNPFSFSAAGITVPSLHRTATAFRLWV